MHTYVCGKQYKRRSANTCHVPMERLTVLVAQT